MNSIGKNLYYNSLTKPLSPQIVNQAVLIHDGSTPINQNTYINLDKWCKQYNYIFMGYGYRKEQPVYILLDCILNQGVYGPCTEEWLEKLRKSL